jgi:hypothetical protein
MKPGGWRGGSVRQRMMRPLNPIARRSGSRRSGSGLRFGWRPVGPKTAPNPEEFVARVLSELHAYLVAPQAQRFDTGTDQRMSYLRPLFWWAPLTNVACKEGSRFWLAVRAEPDASLS